MIAELQTAPIPLGPKVLCSIPRAVVGDHADQGEEVVGTTWSLLHLLVHPLCDVGGKISIKVVAASLLIELFLIAPRGRSAYVTKAKS